MRGNFSSRGRLRLETDLLEGTDLIGSLTAAETWMIARQWCTRGTCTLARMTLMQSLARQPIGD